MRIVARQCGKLVWLVRAMMQGNMTYMCGRGAQMSGSGIGRCGSCVCSCKRQRDRWVY